MKVIKHHVLFFHFTKEYNNFRYTTFWNKKNNICLI